MQMKDKWATPASGTYESNKHHNASGYSGRTAKGTTTVNGNKSGPQISKGGGGSHKGY